MRYEAETIVTAKCRARQPQARAYAAEERVELLVCAMTVSHYK